MNNDNIDAKIREALARGPLDADLHLGQQSLFQQTMQIFRGRNRWINLVMVVVTIAILVFCIYAGIRFYNAIDVKEIVGWSLAIMVGTLAISMLKIWAWLEMEKYSMIREIKRVELQVAMLLDRNERPR